MRTAVYSTRFRKDYKLCQKRNYVMTKLLAVMGDLENEAPLSPHLKEHPCKGIIRVAWNATVRTGNPSHPLSPVDNG
ncbi:MAG: type II toxin-antitoxin system YafQ family toxin [Clostridiales Family XIII bacterium]|jgi:mRNA-degrading endonuclease YafQ of YafQ-DinJ toxin-antitoxin module|nr:type II toxin-antitoxin system YafQ family toxin [Clostridiales Family XIII bacterium]